jgi:hypothetical protein
MRRLHRGDLSAPVLAIIVTIGVIAAGLVLMAWFWWFAPQAGKTGVLTIIGQPALICNATGVDSALISVKNAGSENVTISKVVILGTEFTPDKTSVPAGGSESIKATPTKTISCPSEAAVTGTILTSAGTYVTSFAVVK